MTDHTECEARIRGLMKQIVLGDMAWKVLIKRAREQRDAAEARIRALEEGLREVVSVLVEEQNDEQSDLSFDHLQNRRRAALSKLQASRERWRALLTERSDGFQTTDDGLREDFVVERSDGGPHFEHAKSDCPYPDHYDEDCHGGGPAMRKGN